MHPWQKIFRQGIGPLLPLEGLRALRQALVADDARLIQGATTSPPPLQCLQDCPVEGTCPLVFCGWQGNGLETVKELENFYAELCCQCDERMREPAACRWLVNWIDDTPRPVMRAALLEEVEAELKIRESATAAPSQVA